MPLHDASSWHIMKFDSAKLSSVEAFQQVQHIVAAEQGRAERMLLVLGPDDARSTHLAGCQPFVDLLGPALLDEERLPLFVTEVQRVCRQISTFHTDFERNVLLSLRLSALLLHLMLNRKDLTQPYIEPDETTDQIDVMALSSEDIPIVIGGIVANDSNEVRFLSPGGADQTAIQITQQLDAKTLTIWGEADGILSAAPEYVPDAHSLPALSYREAAQTAYWNNSLLHPGCLRAVQHVDIEIEVRSFSNPETPGTRIAAAGARAVHLTKAVTARDRLCLLVLEGLGMKEVVGIMARALDALAAASINVVLLSQAATEQSAGIVVDLEEKERALAILKAQFVNEVQSGDVDRIYALDPVGIVTVVDDHMRYQPGLTGKMFSTLGRSGINVLTIADGASENNLTAVVAGEDLAAAVQALHEALCLGRRRAHVFLFGAGTIGGQLLTLMDQLSEQWLGALNLHMCLVGLANSRRMIWDTRGIPFDQATDRLTEGSEPVDLEAIIDHLITSRLDRLIVIDATASNEIAALYPQLLENNIAVVTPNKRANTLDIDFYSRLHRAAREHQVPYFYETTVGAGLPVISTLRDLIRSGDEIIQIQGVVSGTLSYLFNGMADGLSFSASLKQAYENGFTEPDPRDDLSGEDVARKMLILAREMDLQLNREDISLEPLLAEEILAMSKAAFLDQMEDLLASWAPSVELTPGSRLHYIGTIEQGKIHIGIQAVSADSPFAQLQGSDNLIVFKTRRYFDNPLTIRGPGAGPAVTAGGVLADVIRAAELVT